MKNLKRVLALTLVVAMIFSFAITAGAASTKTYSDQDQITHADAAAVLTELGVLKGYEDGSFKPQANVTRAEMAKMITVILNKGVDNQSMFTDGTTDLTDVNWHWAKGYITYCYTLGIIAGDGAPSYKFRPDDPVTGTEAAKMLLVALGADVTQEGLVGTNWDVKANALANSTGLFDDTTDVVNQPASRDFVVQMVYNMLSANTIEYNVNYFTGISTKMTDTDLAITKYFGAKKYVGVVTANEFADVEGGDAQSAGKTVVAVKEINGDDDAKYQKDQTFSVSTGEEYLGRRVNLFYNESTKKIIGNPVIKSTDNVIVEVNGKVEDAVKAAGLKVVNGAYEVTSATDATLKLTTKGAAGEATVFLMNYSPDNYYGVTDTSLGGTANYVMDGDKDNEIDPDAGYSIIAVSNSDSSVVDYVFYVAPVLTEVTKVETKGPDKEYTFRGVKMTGPGNTAEAVKADDLVTTATFVKNDYVLVTEIGGKYYVEVPETFKGSITGKTTGKIPSLTIAGDKLGMSAITCYLDDDDIVAFNYPADTSTATGFTKRFADLKYNTEYTYYKDTKGNIAAVLSNDGSSSYALLTGVSEVGGYSDAYNARLLFADGTTTSYQIDKWNGSKPSAGSLDAYKTSGNALYAVKKPVAVSYSLSGGKVELTALSATAATTTLKKETAKIPGTSIYGNSKTVYYYAVKNTNDSDNMSYYTFTGYTNAPTVTDDASVNVTRVWAVESDKDATVAGAVYIWVDKVNYAGASSKDYVFVHKGYTENSDTTTHDCVYIMADGTIKDDNQTIVTNETYTPGIYEYSLKSAGVYELDNVKSVVTLSTVSTKGTTITWNSGTENAYITSKTQVVKLNPDGDKVEEYSDDLKQGDKVVVVKIKDSDDASFVWYVESPTALAVAAANLANAVTAAKNAIDAAFEIENLDENDYTDAEWTAYLGAIAQLKADVDDAVTATLVDDEDLDDYAATIIAVGLLEASATTDVQTAAGDELTVDSYAIQAKDALETASAISAQTVLFRLTPASTKTDVLEVIAFEAQDVIDTETIDATVTSVTTIATFASDYGTANAVFVIEITDSEGKTATANVTVSIVITP